MNALRVIGRATAYAALSGALLVAGLAVASNVTSGGDARKALTLAQFAATTSAQFFGVLSDETGTGAAVAASGATLTNPIIYGSPTGDTACTGCVGEIISASRVRSGAVGATSGTAMNLTASALSLTPGNYECSMSALFINAGTTCVQQWHVALSTTSATLPSTDTIAAPASNQGYMRWTNPSNMFCGGEFTHTLAPFRVAVAATTSLYPVVSATFTTSTMTVAGSARCVRVR